MFGADLEHTWGSRRFYTYFFLCGRGAGVINVVVAMALDPHGLGQALVPTIGASGAIYGVLLGQRRLVPRPPRLDVSSPCNSIHEDFRRDHDRDPNSSVPLVPQAIT